MSADLELRWEWPADRQVQNKLLVRVTNIKEQGGGLFGINKSPSIADNLPDPVILTGTIIKSSNNTDGKTVSIVVPKPEIESINSGDHGLFGLVNGSVCICIKPVGSTEVELDTITCP